MTGPASPNGTTWSAPPGEPLEVPDDIYRRMRWLFQSVAPAMDVRGYCARWSKERGAVRLKDTLVDTSLRDETGVTEKRLTHRAELYLLDVPLAIRPVEVTRDTKGP